MPRGRRGDSAVPDESYGRPLSVPQDTELVDPLQIASEGLEEIDDEPVGPRTVPAESGDEVPDPLAVLSLAIDEEAEAMAAGKPEPTPRRGIFGLRHARRGAADEQMSYDAPRTPRETASDPAEAAVAAETEDTGPRVTTWVDDLAVQSTATDLGAVAAADEEPTGVQAPEKPAGGSRRGPRRRRRRGEDHLDLGSAAPVEHVVDEAWDRQVDGGQPPADFLDAVLGGNVDDRDADRVEEDRIAAEAIERRRLEQERDEAEMAERARLAAERAEEARLASEHAQLERRAGEEAEERRLAAERAEAERIERERVAAQVTEDERIERLRLAELALEEQRLTAEQAERDRIEAERSAAQTAEDVRLEQLRLTAIGAEQQRLAAEASETARIEAERIHAQRAEDDRLEALRVAALAVAAERAEAERIEAIRTASEQAERVRLEALRVEEARVAAERAEQERLDAEDAERRRIVAEREEAQRLAAEEAERQRIAAERAAAEQAEAERLAAEQADAERLAAERAETERRATLEPRRQAAFLAQQERIAAQRAEKERVAAEHAEWERQALERARKAAAPRAPRPGAAAAALAGELFEPVVPTPPAEAPAQHPVESRADVPTPPRTTPQPRATSAEPIPRFVEFRSGSVLGYVFGTLFTVFSVGAVLAILWAVSAGTGEAILGAAGLTALAMVSWWALLSWSPPVVSVSNGLLEISRGSHPQQWDLRDPSTEVTFRGRTSSRSWKAIVRDPHGRPVTIPARTVDAAQFTELVEHYQALGPEADDSQ